MVQHRDKFFGYFCYLETEEEPPDRLMFHSCCGTHVEVINNGRTAHRPK